MLTQSWRSKSAVFRMYHPLTLNGNSNIINAVKRQRNLGLGLYLQLKLFRKSSDVTIVVSYIISALISCNVIIKNYVNRKIKSYIYLLIFTISLWLYCTKEKGKCEKNFFVVITDQDYPCQHIDQWPQESTMYDIIGDNKEKNMCTYA